MRVDAQSVDRAAKLASSGQWRWSASPLRSEPRSWRARQPSGPGLGVGLGVGAVFEVILALAPSAGRHSLVATLALDCEAYQLPDVRRPRGSTG